MLVFGLTTLIWELWWFRINGLLLLKLSKLCTIPCLFLLFLGVESYACLSWIYCRFPEKPPVLLAKASSIETLILIFGVVFIASWLWWRDLWFCLANLWLMVSLLRPGWLLRYLISNPVSASVFPVYSSIIYICAFELFMSTSPERFSLLECNLKLVYVLNDGIC